MLYHVAGIEKRNQDYEKGDRQRPYSTRAMASHPAPESGRNASFYVFRAIDSRMSMILSFAPATSAGLSVAWIPRLDHASE